MENTNVPYIVYESALARSERLIKRLIIALVIAVVINALIVGCFLLCLNQYDFESYQQDGEGVNIIGNMNGVDYDGPTGTPSNEEEKIISEG